MKKLLFIIGTRPEAIKLAPLIKEFQQYDKKFEVKICLTGQHRQMLEQVIDFFKIPVNYDLSLMKENQSLTDFISNCIKGITIIFEKCNPDLVFVQGDTATAFVGALVAHLKKVKIAHIEAGLRSGNKYSPFPEEINRILTDHMSDFHFAPTETAMSNLLKEGIINNVSVVGNTVVDALISGFEIIEKIDQQSFRDFFKFIDFSSRIILVTGHRRENFGQPFKNICEALKEIAINNRDIQIVYPVHLNPNVRRPVYEILSQIKNIHLIEPLNYPSMIWLMSKSYLILTDSGGIQEEAPTLKKPVLVMRDCTERMEGIKNNSAKLVGTATEKIVSETINLLRDDEQYKKMTNSDNPYGDGMTSKRIVNYFLNYYEQENSLS